MQGEKRETWTSTCNETMLRDKLRAFVSRISPPLGMECSICIAGVNVQPDTTGIENYQKF